MSKKIFLFFGWFFVVFFTATFIAKAQSTLEYSTLTSALGGALAGGEGNKKEEGKDSSQQGQGGATGLVGGATSRLYGESAGAMSSKAGSLLGQVGSGFGARQAESSAATSGANKAKIMEFENEKTGTAKAAGEFQISGGESQPYVKVYLKNGSIVEGVLLERRSDSIRVETAGVGVTYFSEEISKIEEVSL